MLIVVTGGSGSGKSALAETIAMNRGTPRVYIATMEPWGEEAQARIKRHKKMRETKKFKTIEQYVSLEKTPVLPNQVVLVECMSNLCANELFQEDGAGSQAVEAIMRGVRLLCERQKAVVLVTNEVFSDGIHYEEETMQYIRILGELNQQLAEYADVVVECVYGIPVILKGELV